MPIAELISAFRCRAPIAAIVELFSFLISRTLIPKMDFYPDEQRKMRSPEPGVTPETFSPFLLPPSTVPFERLLLSQGSQSPRPANSLTRTAGSCHLSMR